MKLTNQYGLQDMHGNVFEWCEDRYGDYPSENVTDPVGHPTGTDRVSRGGSWGYIASGCRSAYRLGFSPGYRDVSIGFRLVRTP